MEIKRALEITKVIQAQLTDMAKRLAKENGIEYKKSKAAYSAVDLRINFAFILDGVQAKVEQVEADTMIGNYIGYVPGDRFSFRGQTYRMESYNRAGNMIALREDGSGKKFKFKAQSGIGDKAFSYLTKLEVQ